MSKSIFECDGHGFTTARIDFIYTNEKNSRVPIVGYLGHLFETTSGRASHIKLRPVRNDKIPLATEKSVLIKFKRNSVDKIFIVGACLVVVHPFEKCSKEKGYIQEIFNLGGYREKISKEETEKFWNDHFDKMWKEYDESHM